jgi:hypothetical protein
MTTRSRVVLALAVLAMVALVGAGVRAAIAAARARTLDGRQEGEVLVGGKVSLRIRSSAGGYSAPVRAEQVADRLNKALDEGATWKSLKVDRVNGEVAVLAGSDLIVTADDFHAKANGTTRYGLAEVWRANLVKSLQGVPGAPPVVQEASTDSPAVDWAEGGRKLVPILSVGTPGLRVGAAQVVGPKIQVEKVKAVAQIDLTFRDAFRIRAYVPVSSLSLDKIQRVQGCSVWAVGELNLLKF